MATFKAKKIPIKKQKPQDIIARFCYYFSQYKYHEARELPYSRVVSMLLIAKKEHAKKMIDLTNISASPHIKKGKGTKKMLEYFNKVVES